jgi:hypothetical protein
MEKTVDDRRWFSYNAFVTKILFIHHSVGRGLLVHGKIRERLDSMSGGDIELWDHDYNRRGLFDGGGHKVRPFPIPRDNTNPDGLFSLFSDIDSGSEIGDRLRDFDLVVMKSCFPNSNIKSDEQLQALKDGYEGMSRHAANSGIEIALLTTPPIRTGIMTSGPSARRAAEIAEWLISSESPVSRVFDLFGRLSVLDKSDGNFGRLLPKFTNILLLDSHPTYNGYASVGEDLANFLLACTRELSDHAVPIPH